MNPACIAWHCDTVRSKAIADISYVVPALEQKLMEEISEDILPLLQTFKVDELKTMYLLALDVCPTNPKLFFKQTKSYFDQFLKEYDTSLPEHKDRFTSFFPEEADIPPMIYGIGYDCNYTPVIQLFYFSQKSTSMNSAINGTNIDYK
jgi:hypothetical protein